MIETKDIYWLAGLLEGEACFGLTGGTTPRIQISMTDKDVIQRAALLLGTPTVFLHGGKLQRQQQYGCAVNGVRAAGWMMTLYSLMGERRQERIRHVLEIRGATRKWRRRAA